MLIHCPKCQAKLEMPEDVEGKLVRCSACQAVFRFEGEDLAMKLPMSLPPMKAFPTEAVDVDDNSVEAEPTSVLDPTASESRLPPGVRSRVHRLSNILALGGMMTIFLGICVLIRGFMSNDGMNNPVYFFGSVVAASLFISCGVFISVSAGSFAQFGSKGLTMTGAILALFVAVPSMFGLGCCSSVIGSFEVETQLFAIWCIGTTCIVQVPCCLWGGIGTIMVCSLPEVGKAFRLGLELRERIAEGSGAFDPDQAMRTIGIRAAWWLGVLCLLIVVLLGLRVESLNMFSPVNRGGNRAGDIAFVIDIVISTIFLVAALGIAIGGLAFYFRWTPILGYIASVLSILVAMFSFCGAFASLPNIFRTQDSTLKCLIGASIVVLMAMLVLSVSCGYVGFSASNLLVRYRRGLAKQTVT